MDKPGVVAAKLPVHVGLILDGNRRWAKLQGLPAMEGHRAGYQTIKTIAMHAADRGIQYASAFVFSTENWQRSKVEVDFLMNLLVWAVESDIDEYIQHGIKLVIVGSWQGVSPRVKRALQKAEQRTAQGTRLTTCLCFNYGARQEIADGVARLIRDGVTAEEVTAEKLAGYMYHPEVPDIDLLIRTSGEQRLSNFMLWRAAYAELLFSKTLWPAYTVTEFDQALADFAGRQRRYGN